jgi:hypothetical protein
MKGIDTQEVRIIHASDNKEMVKKTEDDLDILKEEGFKYAGVSTTVYRDQLVTTLVFTK